MKEEKKSVEVAQKKVVEPASNESVATFLPVENNEIVTTKKSRESPLISPSVQIKVLDATSKLTGGLFNTTHNFYIIETQPYGWKVEREYKQIITFREILQKQFPGNIVNSH